MDREAGRQEGRAVVSVDLRKRLGCLGYRLVFNQEGSLTAEGEKWMWALHSVLGTRTIYFQGLADVWEFVRSGGGFDLRMRESIV